MPSFSPNFFYINKFYLRSLVPSLEPFWRHLVKLSGNKVVTCVRNAKKKPKTKQIGGTDFIVSEIKRVENYPDFEKLAHVIQCGLQGFIV